MPKTSHKINKYLSMQEWTFFSLLLQNEVEENELLTYIYLRLPLILYWFRHLNEIQVFGADKMEGKRKVLINITGRTAYTFG